MKRVNVLECLMVNVKTSKAIKLGVCESVSHPQRCYYNPSCFLPFDKRGELIPM